MPPFIGVFCVFHWRVKKSVLWIQIITMLFKGTVQRDFGPHFFHNSNQPGSLTNGLKYFRFWFRFRRDIRILVSKKMTDLT